MSEPRVETKWEAAARRISEECMPQLLVLDGQMRRETGRQPVAVMLPERYDPGVYDGEDATDMPAQMMGLPVVWGPVLGLVFEATSPYDFTLPTFPQPEATTP